MPQKLPDDVLVHISTFLLPQRTMVVNRYIRAHLPRPPAPVPDVRVEWRFNRPVRVAKFGVPMLCETMLPAHRVDDYWITVGRIAYPKRRTRYVGFHGPDVFITRPWQRSLNVTSSFPVRFKNVTWHHVVRYTSRCNIRTVF